MENSFLKKEYLINDEILLNASKAEKMIEQALLRVEEVARVNQYKVIKAFHDNRISETHFMPSTGYGYGDIGRDKLDEVYKSIFKAEDAFVRQSIASGTVAINLAMFSNLRPTDEILFVTGMPYDTLIEAVGIKGNKPGAMNEYGITNSILKLKENGEIDYLNIENRINKNTKMVFVQRSRGYEWRKPIMCDDIKKVSEIVKKANKNIIVFVDNCYGEFVETQEPIECGADLIAGSLIKNIGGGITPSGGYIVGKKKLIENCTSRFYSPGLYKEVGSSITDKRLLYQGLYLAPHTVSEALKGAIFTSAILQLYNYETSPKYDEIRGDIIQLVKLKNEKQLISFCQSIQKSSPIDAHVMPYPWDMPGYQDKVIMAAGTFIQGASIEFSADAPIKKPYIAYMQGGLVYSQVKLGILLALQSIKNDEII